jgi:archaellum component FlaF (FlaF/FlaG flagellin family)
MMIHSSARSFLIALFVVAGIVLFGCDNTIEPFSEKPAYSVYGYLTSQEEQQFIRVRPLQKPIGTSIESLDATVTLTNRTSGKTRTLQDSVIKFEGVSTHNYWEDFRPKPGTTYELSVDGPDGTTRIETTTPTGTVPTVTPDRVEKCQTTVQMVFREAAAPIRLRIGFRYEGELHWIPRSDFQSPPNREDKVLRFFTPSVLGEVIPTGFREPPPCLQLDSKTVYLAFLYADPNRSTEANTDLGAVFDPTESRRVEGGTGFFGAIRRDTLTMTIDTTVDISSAPPRKDSEAVLLNGQ